MLRCWNSKAKKGTAIVEMAFVLPILVLLAMGMVEFSRVLMVQQVITHAAREGARVGALYFNDTAAFDNALGVSQTYLDSSGVNSELATITPSFITMSGVPALQVVVRYPYGSLLNGWIPGIPETLTLSSTVIMRREV
ncbi:MAG: pilus assembly protein [Candidatus Omnitrophica bacterium]|nr:pilus assembly protein [Candidatus Omnitrophota bacterium]